MVTASHYTTTKKIAKNVSSEFDCDYKVVFCDDKDIGMIIGKKFSAALMESGVVEQIREEMRESEDATTVDIIASARA